MLLKYTNDTLHSPVVIPCRRVPCFIVTIVILYLGITFLSLDFSFFSTFFLCFGATDSVYGIHIFLVLLLLKKCVNILCINT